MAISQEEVITYLSNLTVIDLVNLTKALEDKWTDVVGWEDAGAAARVIVAARELHARGHTSTELP